MAVNLFSAESEDDGWPAFVDADSDGSLDGDCHSRPHCERCLRPSPVCICHSLPATLVEATVDVLVLQTRAESRARIGTAAILPLVLANVAVRVAQKRSIDAAQFATGSVLLFPGKNSVPLDTYAQTIKTLVVLDGSWDGAHKLLQRIPAFRALPQVKLPEREVLSSWPLFEARRPPSNIPGKWDSSAMWIRSPDFELMVLSSIDALLMWSVICFPRCMTFGAVLQALAPLRRLLRLLCAFWRIRIRPLLRRATSWKL
jgi:DTW domain